jgi:ketosteroid isomerase-like protein
MDGNMDEAETREVVMRWFDSLGAGDFEAAMECLDENIHWINSPGQDGQQGGVPGLSGIVPWFGDFRNKAEVMATFEPYAEAQETLKYERLNVMFKDDQALVVAHEVARIKATGEIYDIEFVQRYQVANGRIVLLRAYLDTCRLVSAFRGHLPARLLDAARSGDAGLVEQLLSNGANPNEADPASADSVLMIAAAESHANVVRALLAGGAEPNLVSRCGNTALHAACGAERAEVVAALIEGGALVNIQQPGAGETPMHVAMKTGSSECGDLLVNAGANADITAFDKQDTAMSLRQGDLNV